MEYLIAARVSAVRCRRFGWLILNVRQAGQLLMAGAAPI
jgi:hypothetical protein